MAEQLALARARRAALLQRFTPDHPEVVSLERTIDEIVVRLEGETPVGTTTQTVAEPPMTVAEAAQQKRTRDLQAELEGIDRQLTSNRAEEARLNQTIDQYQAKVDIVPTRESELVELTRDYSTLQAAYVNLLTKREDSVIAGNLERRQIGEQFRLLDVASLPQKPYNQSRRLAVMASGAVAGLVLGLLVITLLEYRDSSFRGEEEVMKTLSVPVLALIPVMMADRERQAAKWRRVATDVGGTAVLMAAGAVLVLWRLQL
jgi:uncharacterized protein involved in exopolysaccharide biosynthesis